MSVHLIPEHESAYFTCDHLGGRPEHRSVCRAAVTIRPDQGGLWMDPADVIPDDWRKVGDAHLCPDHVDDPTVASLTWSTVAAS